MPSRIVMRGVLICGAIALFVVAMTFARATPVADAQGAGACVDCHTTETPGIVTQWTAEPDGQDGSRLLHLPWERPQGCHRRREGQAAHARHLQDLPSATGRAVPRRQACAGLDGNEGHADAQPSAADDRRPGRRSPAARAATRSAKSRPRRWPPATGTGPRVVTVPHAGTALRSAKRAIRGLPDLPHGLRPPALGDVVHRPSTARSGRIEGSATGRAPTCQTCHMDGGDHGVMTAWGFLALRLPEDDPRVDGRPGRHPEVAGRARRLGERTARLEAVKAAKLARLIQGGVRRAARQDRGDLPEVSRRGIRRAAVGGRRPDDPRSRSADGRGSFASFRTSTATGC